MTQQIKKDCVVALRYIMYNSKGDVLEDTMQSFPITYLHGSGGILPMLQQQLEGLQKSDKNKVHLSRGNGVEDDFYFDVIIDDVRSALEEEVRLGYPLQITADACKDDCACYVKLS